MVDNDSNTDTTTEVPVTPNPPMANPPMANPPMANLLMALVALALLLLVGFLGMSVMDAAEPLSADAEAGVFSAQRALSHVEALGQEPRPVGSAAHSRAVDYLQEQLRQLGVEPQVQETEVLASSPHRLPMLGRVRNVVGRLPGSQPDGAAILVAAHYDSVSMSPGAADDLAGVGAMLETLRALRSGDPLSHDVIFLFSDAEEVGLLGARAFVDQHPWAEDVRVILNFEARGNSGASIMFRTNDGNGWIVRQMAAAASPVASSLSHDVFKLMPNDTDFSQLRRLEAVGLDFAFIRGLPAYHTALDSVENLDLGSLQEHGDAMLAMLQRLNGQPLDPLPASGDVSYFNLPGPGLIVYSIGLVLPFAVLQLIAWALVFVMARRRQLVTLKSVLGAAFGFLASILVTVVVLFVLMQQFLRLDGRFVWMPGGSSYTAEAYIWGLIALGVGVVTLLTIVLMRWTSALATALGALFVWVIFALISALLLPGAGYLFVWPALALLIALFVTLRWPVGPTWRKTFVYIVALAPAMVIVPPIAFLVMEGLGLPLVPILCLLLLLLVGLTVPILDFLPRRWAFALAGFAVGFGLVLLFLNLGKDFTEQQPRPNMLFYALDADKGEAVWASLDAAVSDWNAPQLGESPQREPLQNYVPFTVPFLQASAPVLDFTPPQARLVVAGETGAETEALEEGSESEIAGTGTGTGTGTAETAVVTEEVAEEVAEDAVSAEGAVSTAEHVIRAELVSPRGGTRYFIGFESLAQVTAVRVGDQRVEYPSARGGASEFSWLLEAVGDLSQPMQIELELTGRHPVDLIVVDLAYGLPEQVEARPAHNMPRPHLSLVDSTLVRARYLLAP